jgi:hypothetical protein
MLRLCLDSGRNYKDVTLEAEITLHDLEKSSLSGATSATLSGFRCDHDLNLVLSGANMVDGTMDIGQGALTILLSGASRITLDGKRNRADMNARGASVIE